jgi:hypothetical protein
MVDKFGEAQPRKEGGAVCRYCYCEVKQWVSLTGTEINHIFVANVGYPERMVQAVEALLKEKNGG